MDNNNLYSLVMGGNNKNPQPFISGQILKQRYTVDRNNKLSNGTEIYEFLDMKGNLMLLKTLNRSAAYNSDVISDDVTYNAIQKGYSPEIGQTVQLHFMYADRFELINQLDEHGEPFGEWDGVIRKTYYKGMFRWVERPQTFSRGIIISAGNKLEFTGFCKTVNNPHFYGSYLKDGSPFGYAEKLGFAWFPKTVSITFNSPPLVYG